MTSTRITIDEAVYNEVFGTPKTKKGIREIPVAEPVMDMLKRWKGRSPRTKRENLVFGTRSGAPEHPSNTLRRYIHPACEAIRLLNANWLTFRRTFSTWAHHNGVPAKTIAELMGHKGIDTQFIYTQGVDESKNRATTIITEELSKIGEDSEMTSALVH